MQNTEFKARSPDDPRLAVHATSPLPAWLWSADGTRVLWANPVGAQVFGAANGARLGHKIFGPADPHRRQITQLAHRLPANGAVRLERLRGFGAMLGTLITCACTRLEFADGSAGILIAATEYIGRTMPLTERLQRLVEDVDAPVVTFDSDGTLVAASSEAASAGLHHLADAGLDEARQIALKEGRSEATLGDGHVTLVRVGSRADVGLLALITPAEIAQPLEDGAVAPTDVFASEFEEPEVPAETAAEPGRQGGATVSDTPSNAEQQTQAEPRRPQPRRHPLRFMWQMDAGGRFSLGSDAFTRLIGVDTAAGFGRPWQEIADVFALDPDGLVMKAIATREAWSGITLNWPVDDGSRLPIELSGLPIHDTAGRFVGYRGFGICRDLEDLTRLETMRSQEFFNDPPSADMMSPEIGLAFAGTLSALASPVRPPDLTASAEPQPTNADPTQPTELDTPVNTPVEVPQETPLAASPNVVPFRPLGETRSPILTPVENSAFNELARQLSARLEGEAAAPDTTEPSGPPQALAASPTEADVQPSQAAAPAATWLAQPEPPARAASKRDRMLLDLLPTGVMIYRLDRLLYANQAFLERMGYPTLHALEQAGGVDALYVEPGVSNTSSTSDTGTPVRISSPEALSAGAIDARLHTISWDNDSALALIFTGGTNESAAPAAPEHIVTPAPVAVPEPSAVGQANAEELAAILDTTADGIMMFDAQGNISSCNRSAEALFGYEGKDLTQRNLATLFAPQSEGVVKNYLESFAGNGVASLLEHGREVLGRVRGGGLIPLSMTMGRTQARGPNFFAVFRDLSQLKKSESELRDARRLADRTANAKADLLARISHEVRTPLNAIIGFAEVMIGERFGTLGERYTEYMKDVRSAGQRVVAVIDDLTNLSRIETGKLDLAFANQNLNDLVESCVAVMQQQASRERIIIRTSLAQMLPPVVADGPALRQITMNLIGNSIHLANTGGQVIVSTALTDFGEVALRIRDTGLGLNDNEVAAAMEPFRAQAPFDQSPEAAVSLSLTKALVEANRAQFNIKTGARSGTLVEVLFSQAMAMAKT
jgi:PAS domain S-box-containing protein